MIIIHHMLMLVIGVFSYIQSFVGEFAHIFQQNHFTHKLEAKILSSKLKKVCPAKSWDHSGLIYDMYTKFGSIHG